MVGIEAYHRHFLLLLIVRCNRRFQIAEDISANRAFDYFIRREYTTVDCPSAAILLMESLMTEREMHYDQE